MMAVNLVDGGRFLQDSQESSERNTEGSFLQIAIPTISEVTMFLLCLSVLHDGSQKKTLEVIQDYRSGMLIR